MCVCIWLYVHNVCVYVYIYICACVCIIMLHQYNSIYVHLHSVRYIYQYHHHYGNAVVGGQVCPQTKPEIWNKIGWGNTATIKRAASPRFRTLKKGEMVIFDHAEITKSTSTVWSSWLPLEKFGTEKMNDLFLVLGNFAEVGKPFIYQDSAVKSPTFWLDLSSLASPRKSLGTPQTSPRSSKWSPKPVPSQLPVADVQTFVFQAPHSCPTWSSHDRTGQNHGCQSLAEGSS